MAMNRNETIHGLVGKLACSIMIALMTLLAPLNSHALTREGDVENTVANTVVNPGTAAELSKSNAVADRETRRALMEKAIHEEKIRMRTDIRDSKNERREAGEILGFDLFLGGFLTALWSLISLFFATRFFPNGKDDGGHEEGNGVKVFYACASLMPLLLLWVAMSTGHVSWWSAFAVSVGTSGLIGKLLIGIRNSIARQAQPA